MAKIKIGNGKGPKGDAGAAGPRGDTGATGPRGEVGAQGQKGADGKTAYQYAREAGYSGTESEFAALLNMNGGHMADKNNPHSVTAAQVGAAEPVWGEAILLVDGWARESNNEHSLIVSMPAAKTSMKGYPCIGLKASSDVAARKLEREAFALIERAVTADGKITFWCGAYFPDVSITVLFSGGV